MTSSKSEFLGIEFLNSIPSLENILGDKLRTNSRVLHFVAVSSIVAEKSNRKLVNILNENWAICDSRIIELCARVSGIRFQRYRGIDFLRDSFSATYKASHHFFLGSSEENLQLLFTKLNEMSCGFNKFSYITQQYIPSNPAQIFNWANKINESGCDVLWVALGSPKQDYVSELLKGYVNVPIICIGGAVDILSGNKKEAPLLLRNLGFEWLFRFALEPRRLFKRYWAGNFRFVAIYLSWIYRSRGFWYFK